MYKITIFREIISHFLTLLPYKHTVIKKGRITEYSTLHLPMKNMPFGRALQKYIKDWVYQTNICLKSVFVDVILQHRDRMEP